MNRLIMITIAFASIIAQGCIVDGHPDEPTNDRPEMDSPDGPNNDLPQVDAPEGGDIVAPIEPPPNEEDEDHLLPEVEPPIGEGEPEDWEDDGDDEIDGVEVPGDGGDDEDGAHGEGEPGVSDGEDDEDFEAPEIRDECEPNAGQCDDGFACEELCEPSYCDEEGRCTQDCMIVYYCVEQ